MTKTAPQSVMPTAPQNAITRTGTARPIWRVWISRTAAASAEAAPTIAQMLNSEGIGLMTSSAPTKPTPIARPAPPADHLAVEQRPTAR